VLWGHSTPQTMEKDRDIEDMDRDERTCERCEEHVKGRKRFIADGSVRALDYVGLWTFDSEYITKYHQFRLVRGMGGVCIGMQYGLLPEDGSGRDAGRKEGEITYTKF